MIKLETSGERIGAVIVIILFAWGATELFGGLGILLSIMLAIVAALRMLPPDTTGWKK